MPHSVSPSATVCVRADADPPRAPSLRDAVLEDDDARSPLARPDPLSVVDARRVEDDDSADPLRRSVDALRSAVPDPLRRSEDDVADVDDARSPLARLDPPSAEPARRVDDASADPLRRVEDDSSDPPRRPEEAL